MSYHSASLFQSSASISSTFHFDAIGCQAGKKDSDDGSVPFRKIFLVSIDEKSILTAYNSIFKCNEEESRDESI